MRQMAGHLRWRQAVAVAIQTVYGLGFRLTWTHSMARGWTRV